MVFKLFKYLKDCKKDVFLGILFIFLESGLEIIVPFLSSILIDQGLITNQQEEIIGYNLEIIYIIAGVMVVCGILAFVSGIFFAKYVAKVGTSLAAKIREEQYKKVQSFSFNNFDKFRTNSIITRLTTDVATIQNVVTQGMRPFLRAPLMMVFSIVLSFVMSWQLALVFVVIMPILAVLLYLVLRKVRPMFSIIQKTYDKVNRIVQENIIGIKTIKSYVRKDYEIGKYEEINYELYSISKKGFQTIALNAPIMQIVIYFTIVMILYFGGTLHSVGGIKVGALISFLSYVLQLLNTLMMLSNVFMLISRSNASAERVLALLNEESDIIDNKTSDLMVKDGSIQFSNVSFKYSKNDFNVLNDLNFSVESGETVGIIGETGSSKSSLINLIERFYDVSEGSIKISGNNIKDYSLYNLRDSISLVPQNNVLFKGSIKDNLLWGKKDASIDDINEALKLSCSYDFVYNSLQDNINTDVGQGGDKLSGGQRQRICLARAIIKKPKILILDDVTSALDRITESNVIFNLKTKLKETTKIIISQKITSVMSADKIIVLDNGRISQKITSVMSADKIIVLDNGRISGVGSHKYLLENNNIYKEIYQLQHGEN